MKNEYSPANGIQHKLQTKCQQYNKYNKRKYIYVRINVASSNKTPTSKYIFPIQECLNTWEKGRLAFYQNTWQKGRDNIIAMGFPFIVAVVIVVYFVLMHLLWTGN